MSTFLLIIIYIAFISLGLPDSILGSAWPTMHQSLNVPVGWAGIISMLIAAGTIVSSLLNGFLNRKLGTDKVMVFSVGLTALTIFGFAQSKSFLALCLLSFPYGLGGGSVDASLNNYVAINYKARHMSFLHCFWGIGTMTSPFIMGFLLEKGFLWNYGYLAVSIFQACLTVVLIFSIPVWKKIAQQNQILPQNISDSLQNSTNHADSAPKNGSTDTKKDPEFGEQSKTSQALKTPGAIFAIIAFLFYSAAEQSLGLWASSYLRFSRNLSLESASRCGMLFYMGITIGRIISGMVAEKAGDRWLIRIGQALLLVSVGLILLPAAINPALVFVGLVLAGIGCGPIFPSMIHQTPFAFGKEKSQTLIGMQMAAAYTGSISAPTLFGAIVENFSISFLPFYILAFTGALICITENLNFRLDKTPEI